MAAKTPIWTNLKSRLDFWGNTIADKIKRQLKIDKTYASGKTAASIDHEVVDTSVFIRSRGAKGTEVTVLDLIDGGRSRGKRPPLEAIRRWMEDKGVRPKKNGRFVRKTESNMKRAAFGIAKAIGERGTIKRFGYSGSDIYSFLTGPMADNIGNDLADAYVKDVEIYIETTKKPQ